MIEATTFTVNGLHGILLILAALLFLIAGIAAAIRDDHPRAYWPELIAFGLLLWVLTGLVH